MLRSDGYRRVAQLRNDGMNGPGRTGQTLAYFSTLNVISLTFNFVIFLRHNWQTARMPGCAGVCRSFEVTMLHRPINCASTNCCSYALTGTSCNPCTGRLHRPASQTTKAAIGMALVVFPIHGYLTTWSLQQKPALCGYIVV